MSTHTKNHENTKGWGIDANPHNDPTYPMKEKGVLHQRNTVWERPELQNAAVEVLKSTERPNASAVVGESTPPSGLSGMIRRWAYKHSENEFKHWLPLIFADRVNVWEGLAQDLAAGKLPNIFRERGGFAAWKHDKRTVLKNVAVAGFAIGLACTILMWRRTNKS